MIALLLLLAVGGTGLAGWYFFVRKHVSFTELVTHPIAKKKLIITITSRGSLEPADNTFFICKVKAKTQGGTATNIREVIDNGSFVHRGDKILQLDDSALQDQKITQEVEVSKAYQLWKQADLTKLKDYYTNDAAVKSWQTKVAVAEFVKKEYLEGLYENTRIDLQNKRDMARSDLFMWQERAGWSERMSRPGKQYVTVSQAEADEARHKTAGLTLDNYDTQLRVHMTLTKEKFQTQYQGDIDENTRQMELAKKVLEKTLELDQVAVDASYLQWQKQISKLADIETEIADCDIRAPRDGMVVYYVEERARFGSTAGVIAQGESVKEGAKLIAVPDLSQMVVNARIHESMVPRVLDDKFEYTGFSKIVNGSLLLAPNPLGALSAYAAFDGDVKKTFIDKHEDAEKILRRPGLKAVVRANAFPDRALEAHVKFVAPVASQSDFFSSDVKVYQVFIAIDDTRLDGLKPGMDAVVTIDVDSTPDPVATIPLKALMGGVEMGEKRYCFVMADGQPQMREITVGKTNEMEAEVKEGLKEGDLVVLNKEKLLSDKEKVQYGVSASSSQGGGERGAPGAAGDGKKGRGGKGGKGGKSWPKGGGGGMQGGPGMPGDGAPGGGQGGGFGGGGGRRGQGGASPGAKTPANP